MHKILILASTYDLIKKIKMKFDERCAEIKHKKLMDHMSSKITKNFRRNMARYAETPAARLRLLIKDSSNLQSNSTQELTIYKASSLVSRFLIAKNERNELQNLLFVFYP